MCETKIKIVYVKKHVYKDREETAHVKIGEEDINHHHYHHHHHIYIYISKISIMYVKMKVKKPRYKKLKEAPKTTRR